MIMVIKMIWCMITIVEWRWVIPIPLREYLKNVLNHAYMFLDALRIMFLQYIPIPHFFDIYCMYTWGTVKAHRQVFKQDYAYVMYITDFYQ